MMAGNLTDADHKKFMQDAIDLSAHGALVEKAGGCFGGMFFSFDIVTMSERFQRFFLVVQLFSFAKYSSYHTISREPVASPLVSDSLKMGFNFNRFD